MEENKMRKLGPIVEPLILWSPRKINILALIIKTKQILPLMK